MGRQFHGLRQLTNGLPGQCLRQIRTDHQGCAAGCSRQQKGYIVTEKTVLDFISGMLPPPPAGHIKHVGIGIGYAQDLPEATIQGLQRFFRTDHTGRNSQFLKQGNDKIQFPLVML